VLLKNDNTLPLPPNKTVALIGPYANATTQLQGNYQGTAKYIRTMIWGATNAGYKVNFIPGTEINTTNTAGFDAAVSAAKQADIVIYAGGIDNTIEAEGHDRMTIDWPGNQLDLIQRLAQVGKPLVVVQFGGGQLDGSTLLSNSNIGALLWAGYPGQAGGAAVFDILTGNEAPAGRLPVTQYPAGYVDDVAMTDMSLRPGTDNLGRTYRWYKDAVLPFGYGLHYTTFHVSWKKSNFGLYNTGSLAMHASKIAPADTALFDTFTLTVTNTGKVMSDYVALVFLTTDNAGPTPYPIRTLVGYQRVKKIKPGETRKVDIDVTLGSVARTADNGDLVLYPGSYVLQVDVGGKYPTSGFQILGGQKVLDQFPQPAE
jgi:beta-D-xylosidase 4